MNTLELVRSLDPTAGNDPAAAVGDESRRDLCTRIGHSPIPSSSSAALSRPPRRRTARRLVPVLVAAAVVTAATVTFVERPGGSRSEALGPALSFTSQGDFVHVRIVDPYADTARYNKEFKKHHLNITLKLMPGSPSTVGTSPAATFGAGSSDIKQSDDPLGCSIAGTSPCVPQFLIPANYSGEAGLMISRAARPGEEIIFKGAIDGRGEALHGVKYKNLRVSQVLEILKHRGYTVPEYRVTTKGNTSSPKTVPGTYYVKNGALKKDKQVILFVSPER